MSKRSLLLDDRFVGPMLRFRRLDQLNDFRPATLILVDAEGLNALPRRMACVSNFSSLDGGDLRPPLAVVRVVFETAAANRVTRIRRRGGDNSNPLMPTRSRVDRRNSTDRARRSRAIDRIQTSTIGRNRMVLRKIS
jgi:hypothetical protein